MTKEQIIEGNKLISQFMGETIDTSKWGENWAKILDLEIGDKTPKYNESWDWLMPVIEKIESLNDDKVKKIYVSIDGKKCAIWNYFNAASVLRGNDGHTIQLRKIANSKINATWQCCVSFIKLYNSTPNA